MRGETRGECDCTPPRQHKVPTAAAPCAGGCAARVESQRGGGANMLHDMRVVNPRTDGIRGLHDAVTTTGSSTVVMPCSSETDVSEEPSGSKLSAWFSWFLTWLTVGRGMFLQPYQLSVAPWIYLANFSVVVWKLHRRLTADEVLRVLPRMQRRMS
jgi:hypothetical protein